MKEIELKFLEINRQEIEKKLEQIKAKKVFDKIFNVIIFDYPNNSITKKGDYLRLRDEGDKTLLTYKKSISNNNVKVIDEIETIVKDFNETKRILETLGLKNIHKVKKRRTRYKTKDAQFEFDQYIEEYDFIPEFLEIEADEKIINKYQKLLNLKNSSTLSFIDLIKKYKK